ncbi:hypothetical protein N4P33_22250 [Streptomyces sp. 15-116A]|uniref:hypothetical protein n=1 Tax=Streptomyces sp. 15-116A TaxID=2259035 RepID=UPI0021B3CC4D|nr:hypothetical protein [Streptomyces sp. 15-116A]MCT7354853.1 hypothetical protein [Streptomyces sp. 15-116A]
MTEWDVTQQPGAEAGSTIPSDDGETRRARGGARSCPLTDRERKWLELLGEKAPPAPPAP